MGKKKKKDRIAENFKKDNNGFFERADPVTTVLGFLLLICSLVYGYAYDKANIENRLKNLENPKQIGIENIKVHEVRNKINLSECQNYYVVLDSVQNLINERCH